MLKKALYEANVAPYTIDEPLERANVETVFQDEVEQCAYELIWNLTNEKNKKGGFKSYVIKELRDLFPLKSKKVTRVAYTKVMEFLKAREAIK